MIQDRGSNYQFYQKNERAKLRRSVFDKSFLHTTTIPELGCIYPVALFETVPGDTWTLNVAAMLEAMPQVVPLKSRQRLFIHAYYSRFQELWNEAETFVTKGYTGKESLSVPTISEANFDPDLWKSGSGVVEPDSLADYFGLPQGAKYSDLSVAGVSALPFMMYERIFRDYYMNKNYYTEDRYWLPNDDGDLRLNTAGTIISTASATTNPIPFGKLHYRDWVADYFTSALPWPQRGAVAVIENSVSPDLTAVVSASGDVPVSSLSDAGSYRPFVELSPLGVSKSGLSGVGLNYFDGRFVVAPHFASETVGAQYRIGNSDGGASGVQIGSGSTTQRLLIQPAHLAKALNVSVTGKSNFGITADQFRDLFVNQSEMEKMARTDGSYTQFGLAFFGVASKASRDFKPTYIGGSFQSISYSDVLQTSQTTTGDSGSPLGTRAGKGGASLVGSIGTQYCDDYGYIMIVASIMPDTYYHQGLDKMWTRRVQEDLFLPERQKLGMQPILNKELYFSGVPATDDDLWAYQDRDDEYKFTANRISGKIADQSNLSFFPYTQARTFSSLPGYSQSFARADDVRKDYLFAPTEDAFVATFAIGARAVRPMSYRAIPASVV